MSGAVQGDMSVAKRALLEMRELRARLETSEQARREPIAVIGLGCRFPGGADDPDRFWQLLVAGRDAVREVPPDRWRLADLYDPDPAKAGKLYSREGGFLDHVDAFDPTFFGIAPRDAISMDPQHRLLLEVSWEALEHAGIAPPSLVGSSTGVFVGIMTGDYAETEWRSGDLERVNAYTVVGNDFSFAAGRVSYHLGLQGPSIALDTACSASLVSVHLACQSLRCRECDLALAGGVNLMLAPGFAVSMSRLRALSKDGRSKTFDAAADGYGRGEGCGMAVLRRLSDALGAGDPILAVIRGSAVNHDGPSSGLTVPNGRAQQSLIRAALAAAGVDPLAVGYVETHGTGTSLGDPIEVNALAAVLGKGRSKSDPLLLGSVKTNIGHLESAAGIAGLIKVVLTLHHGEIPPLLHLKNPSPLIPWAELPVAAVTERTPWPRGERPRLACLSAFALSGINAHAVLEEAPARPAEDGGEAPAVLFTLSARTPAALAEMARRHAEHLAAKPGVGLQDRAYTLALGRGRHAHRLAVAAREPAALQAALTAFAAGEAPPEVAAGAAGTPPRLAFLFAGQGSQRAGMGRTLFEQEPVFRQAMERCAAILAPHLERPLLEVLYPAAGAAEAAAALLDQTAYTQPALFALEWSLAELWRSWGVTPSFVLGHSVGEYVAAAVAGVFTLEQGLELLARRAALMQALPAGGAMAAVFAEPSRVERTVARWQGSLAVAAINGPMEVVISGDAEAVAAAAAALAAEGVRTRPLRVSHAFHSPRIDPIMAPLAEAASRIRFGAPRVPLISNLTGSAAGREALADPGYWGRQAREPVQLMRSFATLADLGAQAFLELGPQPKLIALGRSCLPGLEASWLPSLRQGRDELATLLSSLGELFVRGLEPAWPALFDRHRPRRVALPAYPFERQRYWADGGGARPRSQPAAAALRASGHPLLGDRFDSPAAEQAFECSLSLSRLPYLADHRVFDRLVLPATAIAELALAAARVARGAPAAGIASLALEEAVELPAEGSLRLQLLLSPATASGEAGFELWSKTAAEGGGWQRRAHGTLRLDGRAEPTPAAPTAAEVRGRCPRRLAGGEVYELLARQGLACGPAFRGIEALWLGEDEALARIARPAGLEDGPYTAHPALLDACQHGALLLLAAAADDGGFLPVAWGGLRLLRPLPDRLWSHLRVRPAAGPRSAWLASILLFDDDGAVVAEIRDLELRRVPRGLFERAAAGEPATDLLHFTWRRRAARPRSTSAPRRWLVLADPEPFAGKLAHALAARGAEVLREPLCRSGEPGFDLAARSRRLGELAAGDEPLGLLMVAPGAGAGAGLDFGWADLLAAGQALAAGGTGTAARLSLLTRGAQPLADEAPLPRAAALGGLARTFALEHPERWGHWIDLAAMPGEADLDGAVCELLAEPGQAPLALRQGERLVAVLAPAPASGAGAAWQARPDASYLITGGLGAVGLEVARWLAGRGARHLVLVGRGGARATAAAALAELEAAGARPTVLAADVSDAGEVQRVLAACDATGAPLAGVFHAAGVLDDGAFVGLDAARFAAVLAPKALGAELLDRATRNRPLDLFVLFSSIASALGSAGQAAYATANALLDALAWERRAAGLPGLAIDWGPWAGAGMAAALDERARRRWQERGVRFLAPAHALALLERALSDPAAQVVAADADWARYRATLGDGMSSALLGELGPRPDDAVSTASSLAALPLPPAEARRALGEAVRRAAAQVLLLPAGEVLDPAQDLHELGLDSLMTMELRNQLQKVAGRPLPATLLHDYRSVAELTRHLGDDVLGLPQPACRDETSRELRKLSHRELETLLAEKRRVLAARRGPPQPEIPGP
jgi:acyl transferase domain-containing protein/acyl carrier protein